MEGLNASVFGEQSSDLWLIPLEWEVLGVDVVENLSEVTLVAWLVLDGLDGVSVALGGKSLACGVWLLEADESVLARTMIGVEGDLQGLDWSELGEELFKLLWRHSVWDFAHKNVVVNDFLWV